MRPWLSTTVRASFWQSASRVMSTSSAVAAPPSAAIAASCRARGEVSVHDHHAAPSRANRIAMARPLPIVSPGVWPPPTTTATLSSEPHRRHRATPSSPASSCTPRALSAVEHQLAAGPGDVDAARLAHAAELGPRVGRPVLLLEPRDPRRCRSHATSSSVFAFRRVAPLARRRISLTTGRPCARPLGGGMVSFVAPLFAGPVSPRAFCSASPPSSGWPVRPPASAPRVASSGCRGKSRPPSSLSSRWPSRSS